LIQNNLELIFYPGRHGWTRIDSVDSVLTENDGFDPKTAWNSFFTLVDMVWPVLTWWTRFWPKMTVLTRKRPETHFLPWSTWFDPYWLGGLGFDRKWRFWPETAWNSFFTLVDMFWPVLTRWTRFWPENSFFTWPTWFDLYWPGGIGSYGKMRLTREKYIFEFSFFLIFLGFL